MHVRCHRNLNLALWSVSAGGRVIAHVADLVLMRVTFTVHERARQRVIAKQCREVHAYAEGDIVGAVPPWFDPVAISYSPYKGPTFYACHDGRPVATCEFVHFTVDGTAVAYGDVR